MRISQFAPVATLLLVLLGCTASVPAASPTPTAAPATPSPAVTATPEPAAPSPAPAAPTAEPTDAPTEEPTEPPTDQPTEEPAGDAAAVDVFDFGFSPRTLAVSAGTQVTWTNTGVAPHTVTFDDEDSGVIDSGSTYQRTFEDAGTFDYLCTIHPAMTGTIEVTE